MSERHGYGDAEARRIIERAAQIDAEMGQRLDAPALRDIAAQAGIFAIAVTAIVVGVLFFRLFP